MNIHDENNTLVAFLLFIVAHHILQHKHSYRLIHDCHLHLVHMTSHYCIHCNHHGCKYIHEGHLFHRGSVHHSTHTFQCYVEDCYENVINKIVHKLEYTWFIIGGGEGNKYLAPNFEMCMGVLLLTIIWLIQESKAKEEEKGEKKQICPISFFLCMSVSSILMSFLHLLLTLLIVMALISYTISRLMLLMTPLVMKTFAKCNIFMTWTYVRTNTIKYNCNKKDACTCSKRLFL